MVSMKVTGWNNMTPSNKIKNKIRIMFCKSMVL